MITPSAIDLANGVTLTDAFAVDEFLMTVQVDYSGIDGDFNVIPRQLLTGSTWVPILDYSGESVCWKITHPRKAASSSGSRVYQIPDGLHVVTCKVEVSPVGGKLGATVGTVQLNIKNTEAEA